MKIKIYLDIFPFRPSAIPRNVADGAGRPKPPRRAWAAKKDSSAPSGETLSEITRFRHGVPTIPQGSRAAFALASVPLFFVGEILNNVSARAMRALSRSQGRTRYNLERPSTSRWSCAYVEAAGFGAVMFRVSGTSRLASSLQRQLAASRSRRPTKS